MSSRTLRVAAAQISSGRDIAENLRRATAAIAEAAAAGAQLVVLPEATSISFAGSLKPAAEPLDGPIAQSIRDAAAEAGITVVAGLFEPVGDLVANTLLLTGPAGETSYRKVHLFDALGSRESDTVEAGTEYVVAEIAGGVKVGLATCYDVRFAEQFTALGKLGAEVVVLPASWGDGPDKEEQWDLLVRARAMDAQAWMVAAGQAWQEPHGPAPLGIGRSAVVDPIGRVLERLDEEPGLLVADLDLTVVADVRERIPVLAQ